MTANLCPCCGADIRVDSPVIIDDFSMFGDGFPLVYKGKPIKLTPHETSLCWTLMKAFPQFASRDAIILRMGSEDAEGNVLSVLIHRVRYKLAELDIPDPIETVRAKGYRWRSAWEMRNACAD